MTAHTACRSCLATEAGCEHAQLYRGRPCCEQCNHDTEETS